MNDLVRTLKVVQDMVSAGIIRRCAIAGAVAAINYIEPALTDDLDLLISVDDTPVPAQGLVVLENLFVYLKGRGYTEFKKEGIVVEGWPVRFLPVADDLDAESLDRAVTIELDTSLEEPPINISILRAEHVVAIALKVGRRKDFERIIQFIETEAVDPNALRDVLTRHRLRDRWTAFCRRTGLADFKEPNFES